MRVEHINQSSNFFQVLSYEDFKSMMKEFNGDILTVGLDCKGAKHNFLDTTTNIAR